ncbi:MAG: tetratricopeptide repeat protein, partial [Pseudomonadota bacterium]
RKSIQLEPNNSESHNNYGSFLCARNRIDDSIQEFLTAVKNPLYSTPALAYTNAGICSARKKDMVNAEAYFKKALQIDPLLGVAAYQLATLQFKRNDAAAAKVTLQNVMLGQPGPELLWLAIRIERAVGAKDAEASYVLQLRRRYPDSEQARLVQSEN